MKEYVAVFFTHSGAIKFDRNAKRNNISCELMPIPRKLSSNCGIGAKFKYNENVHKLVNEEIEKIFKMENKNYILVYEE